jgi:hypothetical protein
MVKAIDLRIGNWVNIPAKGFTQIKSGQDIDRVVKQQAEPIPVTEELLFALGFVKRGSTEIYDIKENNFGYHLGVHRVTIFHPGNQYWHWLSSHIDHVHQIQNLFYCLVGHDITL